MMTTEKIKQMRKGTPAPGYLYIPPMLISLTYIALSILLTGYLSGENATLKIGLILTPILTVTLLYSTVGEVNELVGFAGELGSKSGLSLSKVLPLSETKHIRYISMALLLGAVIVSLLKFLLPSIVWFILLVTMTLLLFLKILKGIQGHYRYNQYVPK